MNSAFLTLTGCAALVAFVPQGLAQAQAFAVATIRPSAAAVEFERDGKTEFLRDTLQMRDVTVNTCIKVAYRVQDSQVSGPDWIGSDRFDIVAKPDGPADEAHMRLMLQALLAERFHLSFHREPRELKAMVLTVAPSGAKVSKAKAPDAPPFRENSATGTVARSMSMQEFADFLAGPLRMPLVDETGLTGKYDFAIDFTPYLPETQRGADGSRPDATIILKAALHDELGLNIEARKTQVQVMVIDHVERPSEN